MPFIQWERICSWRARFADNTTTNILNPWRGNSKLVKHLFPFHKPEELDEKPLFEKNNIKINLVDDNFSTPSSFFLCFQMISAANVKIIVKHMLVHIRSTRQAREFVQVMKENVLQACLIEEITIDARDYVGNRCYLGNVLFHVFCLNPRRLEYYSSIEKDQALCQAISATSEKMNCRIQYLKTTTAFDYAKILCSKRKSVFKELNAIYLYVGVDISLKKYANLNMTISDLGNLSFDDIESNNFVARRTAICLQNCKGISELGISVDLKIYIYAGHFEA